MLWFVSLSKSGSSTYFQRIHALDLATGADRVAAVMVAATYPGTGDNSSGGNVIFNPGQYKERAALLLLNGVIYTAWSSHCDIRPYTGWIMGYDEHTLAQTSVLNVTPNGNEGAIWMAGDGLASDSSNDIYFLDGNGTFDPTLTVNGFPSQGDFGNDYHGFSWSRRLESTDTEDLCQQPITVYWHERGQIASDSTVEYLYLPEKEQKQ